MTEVVKYIGPILMAAEVGMFKGARSELAWVLLLIAARDKRESETSDYEYDNLYSLR